MSSLTYESCKWSPNCPLLNSPAQVLKTQTYDFPYGAKPSHIWSSSFSALIFSQHYCLFQEILASHRAQPMTASVSSFLPSQILQLDVLFLFYPHRKNIFRLHYGQLMAIQTEHKLLYYPLFLTTPLSHTAKWKKHPGSNVYVIPLSLSQEDCANIIWPKQFISLKLVF